MYKVIRDVSVRKKAVSFLNNATHKKLLSTKTEVVSSADVVIIGKFCYCQINLFYIIIFHIKKLFGLLLPSNLMNLNSVGGGIAGCNTLYQLTKRGVNAVLLERAKLTSGTTWHTAGKFKYPFFVQYTGLFVP